MGLLINAGIIRIDCKEIVMANELEKISYDVEKYGKQAAAGASNIASSLDGVQGSIAKMQTGMQVGLTGVQNAVNEQTFALVASQALLARTFNRGFDQVNNTLDMGFYGVSNQLGSMTAAFSMGFARVENVLDKMTDIMNSPLLTQFRELYNRAAERSRKKQFEEALEDTQAALEKNKTDYAAWFLQGVIYAFGESKYSNVVDFDKSIDSLSRAAKYIDPDIAGNDDARRMAAEIHFYLGSARLSKSRALSREDKNAESSETLMKARGSFEESYQYSNKMLESLFNTAKCKSLQGETGGALRDLETLVLEDRNYWIKACADNDFSSMKGQLDSLISKLKNAAFIPAKNDYDRINNLMAELKSLGGATYVTVPATFTEELPYFDVLDYAADFKRVIPVVEDALTNKKAKIARAEQKKRERLEWERWEKENAEAERKAAIAKAEREERERAEERERRRIEGEKKKKRAITAAFVAVMAALALTGFIRYRTTGSFFKFRQNDQGLTITG
jgi:tetratricopeptide (TPR) repeat protein